MSDQTNLFMVELPKSLQTGFEESISTMVFAIKSILVSSKSWRNDEVDIRINRFITSCRDFILITHRYNLYKMTIPEHVKDLLNIAALDVERIDLSYADQIIFEIFGRTPKLTHEDHSDLAVVFKKTIRLLDDLSKKIRKSVEPKLGLALCEQISWLIICLKQARQSLSYLASQEIGDASAYYKENKNE